MSYAAPYAGLKVIDVSHGVAGPYYAMLLAQNGANVIKVEPVEGDWSRGIGERFGDQTAYSIPANLGKRSIALNLKSDAGRTVLRRLIAGADVFIEGFRPGVIQRLGFGYDAVSAAEPGIVYLSISGFGQHGPLAERPAMDPVLQAFAGMTNENVGEDGIPHRVPFIAVDMSTALYAFAALAPTLHARRDERKGRHIAVSLMEAAAAVQVVRLLQQYSANGALPAAAAPSGVYRVADGWINVTVARPHEWVAFCAAIEASDLATDPRFASPEGRTEHGEAVRVRLRQLFAERPFAYWSERLAARKVMHERVNTYLEFLRHPHVAASGAIGWTAHPPLARPLPLPNLPGLPAWADANPLSRAPGLGQHNTEILREHGYDAAEITALAECRAIGPSATAEAAD